MFHLVCLTQFKQHAISSLQHVNAHAKNKLEVEEAFLSIMHGRQSGKQQRHFDMKNIFYPHHKERLTNTPCQFVYTSLSIVCQLLKASSRILSYRV
jgi:hypothetical protein